MRVLHLTDVDDTLDTSTTTYRVWRRDGLENVAGPSGSERAQGWEREVRYVVALLLRLLRVLTRSWRSVFRPFDSSPSTTCRCRPRKTSSRFVRRPRTLPQPFRRNWPILASRRALSMHRRRHRDHCACRHRRVPAVHGRHARIRLGGSVFPTAVLSPYLNELEGYEDPAGRPGSAKVRQYVIRVAEDSDLPFVQDFDFCSKRRK